MHISLEQKLKDLSKDIAKLEHYKKNIYEIVKIYPDVRWKDFGCGFECFADSSIIPDDFYEDYSSRHLYIYPYLNSNFGKVFSGQCFIYKEDFENNTNFWQEIEQAKLPQNVVDKIKQLDMGE